MRMVDKIKEDIYNSSDFSQKGTTIELRDPFVLSHKGQTYVAFLTQRSNFDGSNATYDYTIYSVKEKTVISASTPLYQEIVGKFPVVSGISSIGAKPNFAEKRRLASSLDGILDSLFKSKEMNNDTKKEYIQYLDGMKELVGRSMEAVYSQFKKMV